MYTLVGWGHAGVNTRHSLEGLFMSGTYCSLFMVDLLKVR